jgi:hypothetical protein
VNETDFISFARFQATSIRFTRSLCAFYPSSNRFILASFRFLPALYPLSTLHFTHNISQALEGVAFVYAIQLYKAGRLGTGFVQMLVKAGESLPLLE